jgi:nicotinate-nucleotide pyrophosphorylase (carboxylating)
MSGIATLTRKYADDIQDTKGGTHARVLDTRKTVPGMRALEKYAVLCGGGTNHRIDLASGILIKNNHISLGGGIAAVLKRALEQRQPGQRVQVEVRTPQELDEALAHGAEAILLDNMTPKEVKRSIERIRSATAGQPGRWIPTEASGGIVLDNIRAYAETGVDFISVGALTHSARAADISMSISAEPGQESVRISRGFQGEGL